MWRAGCEGSVIGTAARALITYVSTSTHFRGSCFHAHVYSNVHPSPLRQCAHAQAKFKAPITTEIKPIEKYTAAEPYHQQYLARGGRNGNAQNPGKVGRREGGGLGVPTRKL